MRRVAAVAVCTAIAAIAAIKYISYRVSKPEFVINDVSFEVFQEERFQRPIFDTLLKQHAKAGQDWLLLNQRRYRSGSVHHVVEESYRRLDGAQVTTMLVYDDGDMSVSVFFAFWK